MFDIYVFDFELCLSWTRSHQGQGSSELKLAEVTALATYFKMLSAVPVIDFAVNYHFFCIPKGRRNGDVKGLGTNPEKKGFFFGSSLIVFGR
jgi:hypothetical protein